VVNSAPARGQDGAELYVVSHTHSDFAWADSITGCLDKNVAAVAKSVELAKRYPDFRFCMEHMLAVREYLRRNPDQLETVRKLMREGRFEAGGFFTGPWELTSGPEALVRQLYYGKLWVLNNLGVEPRTVWNVDVAGHTAQLPQILAKAGIKGLVISAGSAGPNLMRWQARDGSSVLTWRTPWGYGAGAALGLRDKDLSAAIEKVPRFVTDLERNSEEYQLPKIGFIADGTDIQAPSERVVENIRRWNEERRFPPMTYSSTAAAFDSVEKAPLPIAAGEMPSPWDTVQSQGDECFTLDRRLDGRVLAAEKLSTFASLVDPAFEYPSALLDEIWFNRLYAFDHNWGGWQGQESDQIKTAKIRKAAEQTEQVLAGSLRALASRVQFKNLSTKATPVLIFNPLAWDRTDVVTVEISGPSDSGSSPVVLDGRGREVASQALEPQAGQSPLRVAFVAGVPSLGYASYYLAWRNKTQAASAFQIDLARHTFENKFFRLELNPATSGIRSLFDKRNSRELAGQDGPYACNELVAFEDDDEDIGLHLTGKRWLAREQPSTIRVLEQGPVRLVIEVSGKILDASSRRQQLILYADLPRLDFVTRIGWQGRTNVQLYQEFPLNAPGATARYAVPYGWEQFGQEMPYAAPWFSHDIKPVLEHRWRGVRGWVELAGDGQSIALASQCNYAAFKDLSADPKPGFLIQPLLLRTVRSCGGDHFFYDQKGEHEFRFALQAQTDPTHLGEELDSPLIAFAASGAAAGVPALPDRLSFLTVDSSNVHVPVFKKAQDGKGVIVRLVEMRERTKATDAELRLFRPVQSAVQTSIIEQNGQSLLPRKETVRVRVAPAGIETIRMSL
jgi:alpha-mannosidase